MKGEYFSPGDYSRHLYANSDNSNSDDKLEEKSEIKEDLKDADLIIERNTVYEIDRSCYERLKNLKKRK